MSLEIGSQYRFTFTVKDDTGTLVNPSTKIVIVTLPDGTIANPPITQDSLGTFHADYTGTQEGLHSFVAQTTGPIGYKTDYVNFNIFRSIVGIDEAKNFINYGSSADEDILRQIMQAATELCEKQVGSCVQRLLINVRIPGRNKVAIRLPQGPLPTETSVVSIRSVYNAGPTWLQANGDFIVSPESGVVELASLSPFWQGPWKATYTVGRLVVPPPIQLAAKEIIYDMWSTHRPYGAGELEPGPEATARFEQMIASYTIPAHAQALLSGYEMPGFA